MMEIALTLLAVLGAILFCGFGGGLILSLWEWLKDWQ